MRALLDSEAPLTSAALAERFEVSPRTIKGEMKLVSDVLGQNGATLVVGNAGYGVEVSDRNAFDAYRRRLAELGQRSAAVAPSVQAIVHALVVKDYVTQDELASALFVSRSTVGKIARQARDFLAERGIVLSSRPHYGYYLIGQEDAIRNVMVEVLMGATDPAEYDDKDVLARCRSHQEFLRLVERELQQGGHEPSDPRTRGLIKYLTATGCRCALRHKMEDQGEAPLVDAASRRLASRIADIIADCFGTSLGGGEVEYISSLLGNAAGGVRDDERTLDPAFFEDVVDDCILQVRQIYGRDFSGDEDLRRGLVSHLYSTCSRMSINAVLALPMLNMVKSQYAEAYDYAVVCGKILLERYGLRSNEDSLGYITMHFAAAIERQNALGRFKVVIVCESGFGTSELLRMRTTTRLSNVTVEAVLSVAQLSAYDLSDVSLVITTVPLDDGLSVPHMLVTPFFDDSDARRVADYLKYFKDTGRVKALFSSDLFFPRIRAASKEEALAQICDSLVARGVMREEDRESLYHREQISSTEINPLVAMPHCLLGEGEKTSYAIFTTSQPVDWKHADVQLIIVALISKSDGIDRQLFPLVYRLTEDADKVARLVDITDFDLFTEKLFSNLPTDIAM